jgi:hypothetical protein
VGVRRGLVYAKRNGKAKRKEGKEKSKKFCYENARSEALIEGRLLCPCSSSFYATESRRGDVGACVVDSEDIRGGGRVGQGTEKKRGAGVPSKQYYSDRWGLVLR